MSFLLKRASFLREKPRKPWLFFLFMLSWSLGSFAATYHVSSSEGDDGNSGTLSAPLASLEALNALFLEPGDSILFKSGDQWAGMFWPKGSGLPTLPIVIDRYGEGLRPLIDGDGYQAAILVYNDDHIVIRNLELVNEASHLDENGTTKKLDGFGGVENSWGSGRDVRFGIKVVADSLSLDHFRMDSLWIHDIFPTPTNEDNIHKGYGIKFETQSISGNAGNVEFCSLFNPVPNPSWPRALTLTTPDAPNSGGEQVVFINVTSLPIDGAEYRVVKTTANGNWYNGPAQPLLLGQNVITVSPVDFDRTVRLQVSTVDIGFDGLSVNGAPLACDGSEIEGVVRLISDVLVEDCVFERTGHYAIWIKSLGLAGIDLYKNQNVTLRGCQFLHTGGSGFVPNKCEDVLVEGCTFNHTGSSQDERMWKRGSGLWPFDCRDVVIQENRFMNAHGPMDSYGAHIDYGCENVVIQYNFSYHNEGGFVEILGDNIRCGYRYNISVNDGYREDPDGQAWDKKGKIFWVGNYCGSATVRCPSTETFIYNNTVFVTDTLNPEIYFWPNVGDVHCWNNLIVATTAGSTIPTWIRNEDNVLDISHNLFSDSARFDLDEDLLVQALFSDPEFLDSGTDGVQDPSVYAVQNQSIVIGAGRWIGGSDDPADYLHHNGGRDFFGYPVSHVDAPNIGAYNGPLGYCGDGVEWDPLLGQCFASSDGECPGDINGDNLVSASDLLLLLGGFGGVCQ